MPKKREYIIKNGEKHLQCSACKEIKAVETEFLQRDKPYKNGDVCYRSRCRECENKKNLAHHHANRKGEIHRIASYRYVLKTTYDMSEKDYTDMFHAQRGECKICSTKLTNVFEKIFNAKTAVDHCHDTGKVRGLLCGTCNTGLGGLKDSPELLRKALEYLEQ